MGFDSTTVAVIAVALAAASFAVSAWQAIIRRREFDDRRKARIAVDAGEIVSQTDHWEVELWLTNVGRSHARRVRVWLEDEAGVPLCDEHRVRHPLMSGAESQKVRLVVPRRGPAKIVARPVRRWRDSRDVSLPKDVSDQRITLD